MNNKQNILLHICCAPCSIMPVKLLREEGFFVSGYWYNPNIHPLEEYDKRLNTLQEFAKVSGFSLKLQGEYGLEYFVENIHTDITGRCGFCYTSRLDSVAAYASSKGYDGFSTTLLVSPYQKHELIIASAQSAADKYKIEFVYRDFRPYFREGQSEARRIGLYMQKYCGCIFSKLEREQTKNRK